MTNQILSCFRLSLITGIALFISVPSSLLVSEIHIATMGTAIWLVAWHEYCHVTGSTTVVPAFAVREESNLYIQEQNAQSRSSVPHLQYYAVLVYAQCSSCTDGFHFNISWTAIGSAIALLQEHKNYYLGAFCNWQYFPSHGSTGTRSAGRCKGSKIDATRNGSPFNTTKKNKLTYEYD